ncbi:MAG: hypothetical protein Aureis2KO_11340 [Aureisphaera sp.]
MDGNGVSITDHFPSGLTVVEISDPIYHYARVISNTRFGHMPKYIVYCENAKDVQWCLAYCREKKLPFRVRSGGHQHEGMSSGNGVMIIDLSKMDTIEYTTEDEAWIPVGKQLGKVYEELETKGRIIPGGGCQSVNVGGLTQGGGWGLSIRKFGMTCDSVLECEIVLPDGTIERPSFTNRPDLFKALKGGGGGNFGVVTRFKFKLASLKPVTTSFALLWDSPDDAKAVMKIWTYLHNASNKLDVNLSTACGMMVADPKDATLPEGHLSAVHTRMGGLFYGSKGDLLDLLREHFGSLIPDESGFVSLEEKHYGTDQIKRSKSATQGISLSKHQSRIADFVNPTAPLHNPLHTTTSCGDRGLRILPDAPSSTCDRPHPHKVTSGFPKNTDKEAHVKLVDAIYDFLGKTCFYSDVNRYMSFHCLGGAVTENTESRIFAFHDKPYMLQIQCWWDDAGNAFTNVSRNKAYVQWVASFREHISPMIEGAFINFVDRDLVPNPETPEGRLKLLGIYYGEKNLEELRKIKTEVDSEHFFYFEMSIPPY